MTTTASIYFNKIRVDYPQAGKDNDSQGFRDNFKNIKYAFTATDAAITDLQTNAVKLNGENDFGFGTIKKATLQGTVTKVYDESPNPRTGYINVDYQEGSYQKFSISSGTSTLSVINWPQNNAAEITININAVSTSTVTFGGNPVNIGNAPLPIDVATGDSRFFKLWTDDGGVTTYFSQINQNGNIRITPGSYISFEDRSIFIGDFTQPALDPTVVKVALGKIKFDQEDLYGIYSEANPVHLASSTVIYAGVIGYPKLSVDTTTVYPSVNDRLSLGKEGSVWTAVYATNGTIQPSDIRLKDNIKDSSLGLNFINDLRPVSYSLKDTEGTHWGLIAQEVKTTIDAHGVEFSGWVEGKDDNKTQHLNYSEFIAPLIKSIQELTEKNQKLEQEITELKKHLGL